MMRRFRMGGVGPGMIVAWGLGLFGLVGPVAVAAGPVEFNRDIRPILSENCFACHGNDKGGVKGDLRLDIRESAVAKEAFVPGQPDESELVIRVLSDDPEEQMPPPDSHKKLNAAQKDMLRRWVAEGAEYQPHWAYVPPRKVELPAVARRDWVRNPVDAFILAALESKGIAPSAEADRRTLIRRLTLDLTGLPPTVEEAHAFARDDDPDAYEQAVDRLLASPQYGERMAVPWLDLARFSDTVGYHGDQNQNVFPYRDYVIDAFNSNKPFDRFVIEQLAGDLLPDATVEQRVATGFNRLNMMTREGGAQDKEYLAKYAGDRVRTVATTFLGSTMGCAECHDHKFDPFQAKDFYRLAAFFGDLKQWGVYTTYGYTPNPDLPGWTNDHPFPPEIEVDSPYLHRRLDRLNARYDLAEREAADRLAGNSARSSEFEAWVAAARTRLEASADGWATPAASLVIAPIKQGEKEKPTETKIEVLGDGSLLWLGKERPKKVEPIKVRLAPGPGWLASIRLDLIPDDLHGGKVVRGKGDTANVNITAMLEPGDGSKAVPLGFSQADADHKDVKYANGSALIGIKDGWKTAAGAVREVHTAVYLLDKPIQLVEGDRLALTIREDGLGRARLLTSPFASDVPKSVPVDDALLASFRTEPAMRTPEQARILRTAFLLGTGSDAKAFAELKRLTQDKLECRGGKAKTLVTEAWEYRPTRVLPRGNWQDESGEVVEPGVPHFLPQPEGTSGRRPNRLDLARWIVATDNPLTARVFANRTWKLFFGTGLSAVMEDLGAQGEPPSHPELLDWLAVDFRDNGWDVKRLVKTMVMSATYRQDARLRPELRDIDPANRLLASQSPRRLDAEFVRDEILAIAGLLNLEQGGPSARPYQPSGYYENIQFPNRDYVPHADDRQYRRGIYTHWQRTFMHPMLANFDAPSREECTASRTLANTPQQALTLLNDPSFVEAARVLARATLAGSAESDRDRINLIFAKALGRPAREPEAASLMAFLDGQRRAFAEVPGDAEKLIQVGLAPAATDLDPAELAAWTETCRVVLNLHETITRY